MPSKKKPPLICRAPHIVALILLALVITLLIILSPVGLVMDFIFVAVKKVKKFLGFQVAPWNQDNAWVTKVVTYGSGLIALVAVIAFIITRQDPFLWVAIIYAAGFLMGILCIFLE